MPNLRPTVPAALSPRVAFARKAANPESSSHRSEILKPASKCGVRKPACLILRVLSPSACGNLQDATTCSVCWISPLKAK